MPNCFSLTRKGESEPASLQAIDDEMRVEFGEEPDPKRWLWGWYDTIGLSLALCRTWEQIRDEYIPDDAEDEVDVEFCQRMLRIIDWLEENYVPNAWAERGRR